jgi:hypothetical protein
MKKFLVLGIIAICAGITGVYADPAENDSEKMKMDVALVSRYMWRGYSLGGPGFQTSVTGKLFENDSHALELEAWGYTDFNVSTKEIDLSLSYSFLNKNATIRLYDYWYVLEAGMNFLDYKNNSTSHTLEVQLDYTFNLTNDNSLTFMWATFVYGNDKKWSLVSGYKQAYSSYFEIKYEGDFLPPKYGCEASVGFSPWESPMNYMVEKFSWINAELRVNRKFNLSDDVELMPSVALTINPTLKDAYISFGAAFSF